MDIKENFGHRLCAASGQDTACPQAIEKLFDAIDEFGRVVASREDRLSQVPELLAGILHAYLYEKHQVELFRGDEHLEPPELEHEFRTLARLLGLTESSEVRSELTKAFYPFAVSLAMLRDQLDMGNLEVARTKLCQIEAWSEQMLRAHGVDDTAGTTDSAHEVVMVGQMSADLNRLRAILRSREFELVVVNNCDEALSHIQQSSKISTVLLGVSDKSADEMAKLVNLKGEAGEDRSVRVFAISDSKATPEKLGIDPTRLDGWFQRPLNPLSIVQAISV